MIATRCLAGNGCLLSYLDSRAGLRSVAIAVAALRTSRIRNIVKAVEAIAWKQTKRFMRCATCGVAGPGLIGMGQAKRLLHNPLPFELGCSYSDRVCSHPGAILERGRVKILVVLCRPICAVCSRALVYGALRLQRVLPCTRMDSLLTAHISITLSAAQLTSALAFCLYSACSSILRFD